MEVTEESFNLKKNSAFKPLADLVDGVMHGEYILKEGTVGNRDLSDKNVLTHYGFDVIRKSPTEK